MNKISKKEEDMKIIAKEILANISKINNKKASVVGLYGDLGAGKTTFTKAVGQLLGIKRKLNSPTFVVIKRYKINNKKHKNLFHLDAYRLKNEKELINLGWEDIISNPENLVFIEWPENVIKAMPKRHHKIHIKHTKTGHRNIKVTLSK